MEPQLTEYDWTTDEGNYQPSKSHVFTINNPTDEDVRMVKAVPCNRIIVGSEVGQNGTPHLQGAIIFARGMRRGAVCKLLGGRAHIKKMRGSWAQQVYCAKDADLPTGGIVRMEDNTKQGERTDIIAFRDAIKAGKRPIQLIELHPNEMCKYGRFEQRATAIYAKERTKGYLKPYVEVRWGKGGTGKTRAVYEMDDVYVAKLSPMANGWRIWWDGYEGEDIILINEYTGQLSWEEFKELTDGYQKRLEVKGGFTYGKFKKMYFTSNKHPSKWEYPTESEEWKRRITKVVEIK